MSVPVWREPVATRDSRDETERVTSLGIASYSVSVGGRYSHKAIASTSAVLNVSVIH